MKKVLKTGTKKEKNFVCDNCNCEFVSDEYNENKLVGRDEMQISDKCPDCKRKVQVVESL